MAPQSSDQSDQVRDILVEAARTQLAAVTAATRFVCVKKRGSQTSPSSHPWGERLPGGYSCKLGTFGVPPWVP